MMKEYFKIITVEKVVIDSDEETLSEEDLDECEHTDNLHNNLNNLFTKQIGK